MTVRINDSDLTIPVVTARLPELSQYRLFVQTNPPGAEVRLRGTRTAYRPGVMLSPGNYTVEVSQPGYESKQATARIVDQDLTLPVALNPRIAPIQYRLSLILI